jgi:NAD(P)-dependent dehydrogenase (short-subunit alcohol dehydrogenase family)
MGVLTGKTALVTGGSRGIGKACALRLARDGALVIVHYGSNTGAAKATVAEITNAGGRAFAVMADLSSTDVIAPLFAGIDAGLKQNGATGIDILVNNAGISMRRDFFTITPEEFDRVFAINTKLPLFVAQAAAQRMGEGGRIINISSMVASRTYGGMSIAYGASKAALEYMTRAMASSLGSRGITCNAIAPGATVTEFTRSLFEDAAFKARMQADSALGRLGQAEDIANAVAMVASPDSQWVTGELIRAGGGLLL